MTDAAREDGVARRDLAAFGQIRDAFATAAARAGGTLDVHLRVAGRTVKVELAGAAMAPAVLPALAHLRVPPSPSADLTVAVWDSASTGTALPRLPDDGASRLRAAPPGRIQKVHQRGVRVFSVLDTARGQGVVWVPDAGAVPSNEMACPLRVLFHLYFRERGVRLVHAAAVGTAEGGVLLAGRSGQGKSTTTLACLGSALRLAGDDYVLLGPPDAPGVHALYSSAKLNPDQMGRFPALGPALANRSEVPAEKAVFLLHDHFARHLISGFPLRAVVVPRVDAAARRPRLVPAARAELLAHIAPSTIFQLPYTGAETLRWLARILRGVPAYALLVGDELSAVPEVLEGLLVEERGNG